MRLKFFLRIFLISTLVLFALFVIAALYFFNSLSHLERNQLFAQEIFQAIFEQNIIINEVLIFGTDRAYAQWEQHVGTINATVERARIEMRKEYHPLLDEVAERQEKITFLFSEITQERRLEGLISQSRNRLLLSSLFDESQQMISSVRVTLSSSFARLEALHRTIQVFGVLFVVFLVAVIIVLFTWAEKILYYLREFIRDTKIIGNGNFKHRSQVVSRTELGDFSMALNAMAGKLETYDEQIRNNLYELRKFQLAVENASDHIVITDTDGTILYANRAAERMTGYTKNEMINAKPSLWCGADDKSVCWKMLEEVVITKQPYVGDILNRKRDGASYSARRHVAPVLDATGDVQFLISIERDITKEKEIDHAKTEFVSLASHQLRTPLSSVNWYTEMLLSGDGGDVNTTQRQFLNEVYIGSQRMVALVDTLLNVSRIELGTFSFKKKPMDVITTIDTIIDELDLSIMKKNITIRKVFADGVPRVYADSKMIQIALHNVIANAIKYSPEGKHITIDVWVALKGQEVGTHVNRVDSIAIAVSDEGIGIPEEDQEFIFSKMYRADNVQQHDTEGTGLGLYLSREIIHRADGRIWFVSEEDEGTTFYITIPLK